MNLFKNILAETVFLVCAVVVFFTASSVRGMEVLVDDCEGGTNVNKLGAPWFFYDDSALGGNSKIAGISRDAAGKIIGTAPLSGQGNNGTAGYRLTYTMGTTKALCRDSGKIIPNCGFNFVGIGTMLAPVGSTFDITGATAITFWAKASAEVRVSVQIATTEVIDSNYYRTLLLIGTTWAKYTVVLVPRIGIDQQYGWGKRVDFNPKNVTKILWEVHSDQNPPATGTLNLDEVIITNDVTYITKATVPKQAQSPTFFAGGLSNAPNYSLPDECFVSLNYYDVRGKRVASYVNGIQEPGNYSLPLTGLAHGNYIQIFSAGKIVKKRVVVR